MTDNPLPNLAEDETIDPEDETKPDLKRPRSPEEDLLRCLLAFGEVTGREPPVAQ